LNERIHPLHRLLGGGLILATLAAAQTAYAQAASQSDTWKLNLGVGVIKHQDYPGSGSGKLSLRPIFGASYGRWAPGTVPGAATPLCASYALIEHQAVKCARNL